jgi:DNA-binding response OmpR family regulator
MPRFSGFDFLEWLRHKSPDALHLIPVVVLSSSNLSEDVVRAYALGASSYLVKPGSWNDYKNRLRAIINYWTEHTETPELPSASTLSTISGAARPALAAAARTGKF